MSGGGWPVIATVAEQRKENHFHKPKLQQQSILKLDTSIFVVCPAHFNVGVLFGLQGWKKMQQHCGRKLKQSQLLEKHSPTFRCGGQSEWAKLNISAMKEHKRGLLLSR